MAAPSHRPATQAPPGVNVWRLRSALGWSQRTLAERCKPALDHTTVRRVERNAGYTQDTLERIAAALRVPLAELLLPPELAGWTQLSEPARERIAHLVRDTLAAEQTRRVA